MQSDDPCVALVRELDRDRYIATMFAPKEKQAHLMALYAFNCEIRRIPKLVSEPQLGEIRLQWWHDTLAAEQAQHPIAAALHEAVVANELPVEALQSLIEAHRFDLYADTMPSRHDLDGYMGETSSVIFQMAAQIVAPQVALKTTETAGYAGVAYGIATCLADARFIPKGETTESLTAYARQCAKVAKLQALPKDVLPAYLPMALLETRLNAKGKPASPWFSQWILWQAARREIL